MKKSAYIGIDPGKKGAACLLSKQGKAIYFIDWPKSDDISTIIPLLNNWNETFSIELAVMEKVSAMPGQGVVSMFSFGKNVGRWEGIIQSLRWPLFLVSPNKWRKGLVSSKDGPNIKAANAIVANRLFPQAKLLISSRCIKPSEGRVDALLIAHYARTIG